MEVIGIILELAVILAVLLLIYVAFVKPEDALWEFRHCVNNGIPFEVDGTRYVAIRMTDLREVVKPDNYGDRSEAT